jgi:hypothetical protein
MKKTLQLIIAFTLLLGQTARAQQTVAGVVKDAKSTPVEGATVLIKGTGNHTTTDVSGQFTIPAPEKLPFSLRISAVGV